MRLLGWLFCLLLLGCGTQNAKSLPTASAMEPDAGPAPLAQSAGKADLQTRKSGSDWPAFLGPFGTSVSPEKGILAPWPKEGLKIIWQTRVGNGYGMPSISQGRLFQFDRHGNQARLTCLNSETGEFFWKFEYPTEYEDSYGYSNGPRCCPVVDGDRVYIYGAEGMLHCLRVTDGKLHWKVDTHAEFNVIPNFFGVGSTPVVFGDLLLVHVGGSPKTNEVVPFQELKGNGSALVAFDKVTGKVRYRVGDELASYAGPVVTTIKDRPWGFVFARGGLLGFEPATGKIDFHYPWRARVIESVNASNPVVVGDRVFITEAYGPGSALLRVKPGGCEELWTDLDKGRDKSMQCHWNTPIHHNGYLYGSSARYSNQAELRCVELETGKVMWRQRGLNLASLLMVDGHFICLTEEGVLLLLKVTPERYEEVSRLELMEQGRPVLEYPCWAAPILSHGLLYVRGKDRLVCLELIPRRE
jgi:outer membrane protein assembly factor BamB